MHILETIGVICTISIIIMLLSGVLLALHIDGYEKGVASYNEAIAECEKTLPRTQTCHMVAVPKPEEE